MQHRWMWRMWSRLILLMRAAGLLAHKIQCRGCVFLWHGHRGRGEGDCARRFLEGDECLVDCGTGSGSSSCCSAAFAVFFARKLPPFGQFPPFHHCVAVAAATGTVQASSSNEELVPSWMFLFFFKLQSVFSLDRKRLRPLVEKQTCVQYCRGRRSRKVGCTVVVVDSFIKGRSGGPMTSVGVGLM
jgi:hypothetical protein